MLSKTVYVPPIIPCMPGGINYMYYKHTQYFSCPILSVMNITKNYSYLKIQPFHVLAICYVFSLSIYKLSLNHFTLLCLFAY